MRRCLFFLLAIGIAGAVSAQEASPPEQLAIVVVGAEGSKEYGEMFREWAANWQQACETGGAACETIGLGESEGEPTDRERLEQLLAKGDTLATRQLWLVLIGHGTFDGKVAKFNLRGPDIAASELGEWLKQVTLPTAIINTSSSSAPFMQALSGENRLVVTATKSGHESNFARLGGPLSEAIANPAADLDKDGQVSLLEAWLTASREVAEFYESDARLATEHSLLDDNGDKLGTPADWFRGVRATRRAKPGSALDGLRAHQFHLVPSEREASLTVEQRDRRDELERQIESLREEKETLGEEVYYERLEKLLLELAKVYETSDDSSEAKMTRAEFWAIIESAPYNEDPDVTVEAIRAVLEEMPLSKIVDFDRHVQELLMESYTQELWGGAYLLNGGCSDDWFDYFRGWLILQGQSVFERSLKDPDSMAELPDPGFGAFCQDMLYAASSAYEAVTGEEIPYEPKSYSDFDEWWDFDDNDEMRKRYPKLFARYVENQPAAEEP